ncbi:unnamed protein product [Urochloa humidicola]
MAPSDLLHLLLAIAAAASLLAPSSHLHAQAARLHRPASTNRATSWTISLKDDDHGAQHLAYSLPPSVHPLSPAGRPQLRCVLLLYRPVHTFLLRPLHSPRRQRWSPQQADSRSRHPAGGLVCQPRPCCP